MRNVRGLFFLLLLSALASCREKTADDFPVWGLDVSRHQQNVDWEKVVEHEKPWFVFIKATEGTLIVDPTYDRHRRELERADVTWGAYHFFGHRTPGREQARNFIRTARLEKGNLLPVLDIEQHRFMTDPKRSVREAKAFCDEIRRYYGADPIIYCSTHFYETYLKKEFSPVHAVDRRLPGLSADKMADMAAYRLALAAGHPGKGRPERFCRKRAGI